MSRRPDFLPDPVVYTPASPLRRPLHLLRLMFRDLRNGRELAWRIASQDIHARYRQTALGLLWIFVTPLVTTLAWLFIQSSGVVAVRTGEIPYPVFVVSGILVWSIFADAVVAPLQQAQASRQVLSRIRIPPEALVLSAVYGVMFTAMVKTVVLLCALAWLGVMPTMSMALLPVAVLSLVLVGTALGLAMTPVGLLYNDVGRAIPLGLQFLMYLSPVVYATPKSGFGASVLELNPMTTLVEFSRAALLGMPVNDAWLFLGINLAALLLLLVGWMFFRAVLPALIERMGS